MPDLRRRVAALATVLALFVVAGCSHGALTWSRVDPSPGADAWTGGGEASRLIHARLDGIVQERHLVVVGTREELLPPIVDWAAHRTWRDAHSAGLASVEERLPEPDAPVLVAEWGGRTRSIVAIAHANPERTRLVVLTALLRPG